MKLLSVPLTTVVLVPLITSCAYLPDKPEKISSFNATSTLTHECDIGTVDNGELETLLERYYNALGRIATGLFN